ncbi:MAG TPA: sulfite exporter TauE/SafE family protein [Steroidobacteraceae bacterium]|nr:sulfite exporter TauE/SafE family protein [Steroidobacteraceae bacterium]
MSLGLELWLFSVAAGTSLLGGMLGMASGVFIVPVLTLFGHLDIRSAIGASLVSVIACSCASAAPFLHQRLTNIRLAIVLETATTLGALTGVLLVGAISTAFLFGLFGLVLLLSAVQMLRARRQGPQIVSGRWAAWQLDGSYPDPERGGEVAYEVHRVPAGLGLMYLAGLLSALLGIGSGVLKVPAMDTALRLPIKVSSATSNFMIGVTAAASAVAYFVRGIITAPIAAPVALGSVLGALLGARILLRVPSARLRLMFVVVLAALAIEMIFNAFGVSLTRGPS